MTTISFIIRDDLIDQSLVTEDMIAQCLENPVKSCTHTWRDGYKDHEAYDVLNSRGRRLYDDLRTQFNIPHGEAFEAALTRYGMNHTLFL